MTMTYDNTNSVLRKTARIEDKATGKFVEEIEFPVGQRRSVAANSYRQT
jgi:hypothetical protein